MNLAALISSTRALVALHGAALVEVARFEEAAGITDTTAPALATPCGSTT